MQPLDILSSPVLIGFCTWSIILCGDVRRHCGCCCCRYCSICNSIASDTMCRTMPSMCSRRRCFCLPSLSFQCIDDAWWVSEWTYVWTFFVILDPLLSSLFSLCCCTYVPFVIFTCFAVLPYSVRLFPSFLKWSVSSLLEFIGCRICSLSSLPGKGMDGDVKTAWKIERTVKN